MNIFTVSRHKIRNQSCKYIREIKKKHRLFDFRFLYFIVKNCIIFYDCYKPLAYVVANYVILSKINVTNKVGQFKTVRPLVLNVSFIYDKTSPGKGGMIGTVYRNSSSSTNNNYCLSRSSPEDPVNLKFRSAHVLHGPMRA